MGRPPGALSGRVGGRHPQDWEFRDDRFVELDGDRDDLQEFYQDPDFFTPIRSGDRRGHVSDELFFDGYDMGPDMVARRDVRWPGDLDTSDFEYPLYGGRVHRAAVLPQDDDLTLSALERISRARTKGKTSVSLSEAEMVALGRSRYQQPEPPRSRGSPPITPAKSGRPRTGSRKNSGSSLVSPKVRSKKGSSGSKASPSPATSNSKAKITRNSDQSFPVHSSQTFSGDVSGHGPVSYPPASEYRRSAHGSSAPSSRSASTSQRQDTTPPERYESFPQYMQRSIPHSAAYATSGGWNYSLPDQTEMYPAMGRQRSGSARTSSAAYSTPADYDLSATLPAAHGHRERSIAGAPSVRYSPLRRVVASSLIVQRETEQPVSWSEPDWGTRTMSGRPHGRDTDATSSSSNDDQAVRVDATPHTSKGNGYIGSSSSAAAQSPTPQMSAGTEGRRRKSRK